MTETRPLCSLCCAVAVPRALLSCPRTARLRSSWCYTGRRGVVLLSLRDFGNVPSIYACFFWRPHEIFVAGS